ncbi:unnamed protein product [Fraxinus pennsylvanica]|uniref:Uncharacterized protein n=1 Tax=Fraxinus pennsylvanica TaxID=56036 RepID=A0AAD1YYI3_9LAMI|nr:unnamed protein product [Fraxinus pennsylvanica]
MIWLHICFLSWVRRTKKQLIFPGKPSTKKKKKKVLSKLETSPQDDKTLEQSTPSEHHDVHDDVEAERIIRKSTRTAVIVRQAERDAICAALQAMMKVLAREEEVKTRAVLHKAVYSGPQIQYLSTYGTLSLFT